MIITADRASDILELIRPCRYDAHVEAYKAHQWNEQWRVWNEHGFANVMAELQKVKRRAA